jgi:hypothetical protein
MDFKEISYLDSDKSGYFQPPVALNCDALPSFHVLTVLNVATYVLVHMTPCSLMDKYVEMFSTSLLRPPFTFYSEDGSITYLEALASVYYVTQHGVAE